MNFYRFAPHLCSKKTMKATEGHVISVAEASLLQMKCAYFSLFFNNDIQGQPASHTDPCFSIVCVCASA